MCVNSTQVFTRSKEVDNLSSVIISTKCGHCIECNMSKLDGYRLRCIAELEYIKKNGGFVYFDTLTYNDNNLPKTCGISHFNRKHITDYIRNLRKTLKERYNLIESQWKYLLTCEYGTSLEGTHRPHYHVLFFVHNKEVTPAAFHKYLSEKWKFGFTDLTHCKDYRNGIVYWKNPDTLYQPKFPPEKAIDYVVKYVIKDQVLTEKILNLPDDKKDLVNKLEFKPFIKISINFGKCLIDSRLNTYIEDVLLKNGYYTFKDGQDVRNIPIPPYYYRKMFYHTEKVIDDNGNKKVVWVPNSDKLIKFKLDHLEENIKRDIKNINMLLQPSIIKLNTFGLSFNQFQTKFNEYLAGRSIRDFVIYKRFYQNRFNRDLIINLKNYSLDALRNLLINKRYVCDLYGENYNEQREAITKNLINEESCFEFRDFDKLDYLIKPFQIRFRQLKSENKQRIYDLTQRVKPLYKNIYGIS